MFKDKKTKYIVISLVIVIFISIAALTPVVATVNFTQNTFAKGVFIETFDVSGKTLEQATTILKDFKKPDKNITVSFDKNKKSFKYSDVIKEYYIDKTIKKAFEVGKGNNSYTKFFSWLNNRTFKIEYELDDVAIELIADELSDNAPDAFIAESYRVESGKLILNNGKSGVRVDIATLKTNIRTKIDKGEEGEIAQSPVNINPQPLSAQKIYKDLAKPPRNPETKTENGKLIYIKGENGYDFSQDELAKLISDNKDNTNDYSMQVKVLPPAKPDEAMNKQLFSTVLSTYTSKITDSNADRISNVRKAGVSISNIIVNPGETFSYNKALGPVTAAAGYKEANVYSNGKIERGIGGGVCQMSSTLYNALLLADVKILKRYNHSLTVGYVPYGQDATVSGGSIDLVFENTSGYPIKIVASVSSKAATVTLYGKPQEGKVVTIYSQTVSTTPFETVTVSDPTLKPNQVVVETNGKNGYVVLTYKRITINGVVISDQVITRSVYKVLNRVEKHGPSAQNTDVQPSASPSTTAQPNPITTTPSVPIITPENTPISTPIGSTEV